MDRSITQAHCNKVIQKQAIKGIMDVMLGPLRETARVHGYALAVHGSLEKDIDIVAAPWVDDATSADELAEAIADASKRLTGWGNITNGPEDKPHGRRAYSIIVHISTVIDLSVMPKQEQE